MLWSPLSTTSLTTRRASPPAPPTQNHGDSRSALDRATRSPRHCSAHTTRTARDRKDDWDHKFQTARYSDNDAQDHERTYHYTDTSLAENFHAYRLIWAPDSIVWAVVRYIRPTHALVILDAMCMIHFRSSCVVVALIPPTVQDGVVVRNETNRSVVPQAPMVPRLHTRCGYNSDMAVGGSFQAFFKYWSYSPLENATANSPPVEPVEE